MAKSLDYKLNNMIAVKSNDSAVKLRNLNKVIDLLTITDPQQLSLFFNSEEVDRIPIRGIVNLKQLVKELMNVKTFENFVEILNKNNANIFSNFKLKQIQKTFSKQEIETCIDALREYDLKLKKTLTAMSTLASKTYVEQGIWPLFACSSFLTGATTINKAKIKAPLINIAIDFVINGTKMYIVKKDKALVINERLYVFLLHEYQNNIPINEFANRNNLKEIINDLEKITKQSIIYPNELFFQENNNLVYEKFKNDSSNDNDIGSALSITNWAIVTIAQLTGGKLKQDLSDILANDSIDPFESTTIQKSVDYFENEVISGKDVLLQIHRPINIYQKYAIKSSLHQNTVIIGAPGTGKSEVITNLIANIIYNKSNAMLVSEKKAALDVLVNRSGKLNPLILYTYDFHSKDNFYQYIQGIEEKLGQLDRNDEIDEYQPEILLDDKIREFANFYSHFSNLINSEIIFSSQRDPYNENYIDFGNGNYIGTEVVEKTRICGYLLLPNNTSDNELWNNLSVYMSRSLTTNIVKKFQNWFEANHYIFDEPSFDSFIKNVWNEYVYFKNLCIEYKELINAYPSIIKFILQIDAHERQIELDRCNSLNTSTLAKFLHYKLEKGYEINKLKKLKFMHFSNKSEKKKYKKIVPNLRDFFNKCSRLKALNWISFNKIEEFELNSLEWKLIIQENWWQSLFNTNPLIDVLKTHVFQELITLFKRNEEYFTHDNDEFIFNDYIVWLRKKIKNLPRKEINFILEMFRQASRSKKPSVGFFIKKFYNQLRAIFPIWVMSPDGAAEYIPLKRNEFNYGIFDEASQMFLERGYPLVYRCTYNTIVGDMNQLKPTSFFMTRFEDESDSSTKEILEDKDIDQNEAIVSLLEKAESARWNKFHLRNHYRSISKQLMKFSNDNIYNNNLRIATLNGMWKEKSIELVQLNGTWINRCNSEEANEVIRLVKLNHKRFESILIIAFNLQQANLIEDLLTNGENIDTTIKEKINKFIFITNLENVQGIEADLVILSVAFAPNEDGILRANFGAINRDGGRNRLNVAITRARKKMIVLKSFKASDLTQTKTFSSDAIIFINWIRYLDDLVQSESRELMRIKKKNSIPEFNNLFASQVYDALIRENLPNNYYISTNLPVGDKVIDIGIMDSNTGRCTIGILIDRWTSNMSLKEKIEDYDHQMFLESRDYKMFRIREYEWISMKDVILNSIKSKIEIINRTSTKIEE